MAENAHLPEEDIFKRINAVRKRLGSTDRTDNLEETKAWERRAKRDLILLNLKKHEGIQMILDKAKEEISIRNKALRTERPTDLSPNSVAKYATERAFHFQALDLWTWFLSLFLDAEQDLKDLEAALEYEEGVPDEEY
jgi:hypothetical protein